MKKDYSCRNRGRNMAASKLVNIYLIAVRFILKAGVLNTSIAIYQSITKIVLEDRMTLKNNRRQPIIHPVT